MRQVRLCEAEAGEPPARVALRGCWLSFGEGPGGIGPGGLPLGPRGELACPPSSWAEAAAFFGESLPPLEAPGEVDAVAAAPQPAADAMAPALRQQAGDPGDGRPEAAAGAGAVEEAAAGAEAVEEAAAGAEAVEEAAAGAEAVEEAAQPLELLTWAPPAPAQPQPSLSPPGDAGPAPQAAARPPAAAVSDRALVAASGSPAPALLRAQRQSLMRSAVATAAATAVSGPSASTQYLQGLYARAAAAEAAHVAPSPAAQPAAPQLPTAASASGAAEGPAAGSQSQVSPASRPAETQWTAAPVPADWTVQPPFVAAGMGGAAAAGAVPPRVPPSGPTAAATAAAPGSATAATAAAGVQPEVIEISTDSGDEQDQAQPQPQPQLQSQPPMQAQQLQQAPLLPHPFLPLPPQRLLPLQPGGPPPSAALPAAVATAQRTRGATSASCAAFDAVSAAVNAALGGRVPAAAAPWMAGLDAGAPAAPPPAPQPPQAPAPAPTAAPAPAPASSVPVSAFMKPFPIVTTNAAQDRKLDNRAHHLIAQQHYSAEEKAVHDSGSKLPALQAFFAVRPTRCASVLLLELQLLPRLRLGSAAFWRSSWAGLGASASGALRRLLTDRSADSLSATPQRIEHNQALQQELIMQGHVMKWQLLLSGVLATYMQRLEQQMQQAREYVAGCAAQQQGRLRPDQVQEAVRSVHQMAEEFRVKLENYMRDARVGLAWDGLEWSGFFSHRSIKSLR